MIWTTSILSCCLLLGATLSASDKKGGIGHYGPFEVDVVADRMTKVEWRCDTGVR